MEKVHNPTQAKPLTLDPPSAILPLPLRHLLTLKVLPLVFIPRLGRLLRPRLRDNRIRCNSGLQGQLG
jgi:hypothetical protein